MLLAAKPTDVTPQIQRRIEFAKAHLQEAHASGQDKKVALWLKMSEMAEAGVSAACKTKPARDWGQYIFYDHDFVLNAQEQTAGPLFERYTHAGINFLLAALFSRQVDFLLPLDKTYNTILLDMVFPLEQILALVNCYKYGKLEPSEILSPEESRDPISGSLKLGIRLEMLRNSGTIATEELIHELGLSKEGSDRHLGTLRTALAKAQHRTYGYEGNDNEGIRLLLNRFYRSCVFCCVGSIMYPNTPTGALMNLALGNTTDARIAILSDGIREHSTGKGNSYKIALEMLGRFGRYGSMADTQAALIEDNPTLKMAALELISNLLEEETMLELSLLESTTFISREHMGLIVAMWKEKEMPQVHG